MLTNAYNTDKCKSCLQYHATQIVRHKSTRQRHKASCKHMTVVVHSCVPVNHPLKPYGNIKPKQ